MNILGKVKDLSKHHRKLLSNRPAQHLSKLLAQPFNVQWSRSGHLTGNITRHADNKASPYLMCWVTRLKFAWCSIAHIHITCPPCLPAQAAST